MKNCLGIEIGHYRIKIAYAEKGELKEFISERVQGMDLTDMHVCADLIKDLLKEYAIRCRNVVFVIRQEDVYVRRFEMPLMTEEQLRLNLPYEFHDYIGDEMDKYVFDYAMIQTKERTMDLLGAACTKTLSQQFEKAGKDGAPEARRYWSRQCLSTGADSEYAQERKDYAVLDLGTQALRIHFFREGVYDITRTMEPGCEEIEQIRLGDKNKMQELGIEVEEENREETDKEKMAAVLEEQYRTRAVQVMRVLNFYSFNNVNNTIDSLYYCGGGARYGELIDALKETLDLPVRSVAELLPEVSLDEEDEWIDSPQAYGVLLA
ncbi:MAG: pilus assembly protein PilM [Clostridium fessum]